MKKIVFLLTLIFSSLVFAAPETWQLSPQAFGPIKIGMSMKQAEEATGKLLNLDIDPNEVDKTAECRYATFAEGPKDVRLMLNRETIVRIDVTNPKFTTTLGVKVGVAESLVKSLYPTELTVQPDKYASGKGLKQLIITPKDDPNYRLIFNADGKKVTAIRIGRYPEVEYVEGCS